MAGNRRKFYKWNGRGGIKNTAVENCLGRVQRVDSLGFLTRKLRSELHLASSGKFSKPQTFLNQSASAAPLVIGFYSVTSW
jgi:hypothetical protein